MRVDPNYLSNLSAALTQSSATVQQLTTELSSGLAVSQLSDNPVAASQDQLLAYSLSQLDSFTQAATTEQSLLQVTDSTLGEVVTQLTSAISLGTSAANGTLSSSDLSSIGTQLTGIRDQVLSLANTAYLGQYLFSGSKGSVEPFTLDTSTTPPTVTYHGDTVTQNIETPAGQKLQINLPGSSIFNASGASVLGSLNQLIADVNSGDTSAIATDVGTVTSSLDNVSSQRSILDGSLNQLESVNTYTQTQATQITAQETALVQADPATVATQLSTAETQNQALLNVIAALSGTKSDLFDYLQ